VNIGNGSVTGKTKRLGIPDDARPLLLPIARRVFWWGEPEEWLDDAIRFAAQVMTYGNWEDTATVWKVLGDDLLRKVLEFPPPGVFDIKSWTYWHVRYGLPIPPLPERKIGDV